jgi:hypothetical protein
MCCEGKDEMRVLGGKRRRGEREREERRDHQPVC